MGHRMGEGQSGCRSREGKGPEAGTLCKRAESWASAPSPPAAPLGPRRGLFGVLGLSLKLSPKMPTSPGRQQLSETVGPPSQKPCARTGSEFPGSCLAGDEQASSPPSLPRLLPQPQISMATLDTTLIWRRVWNRERKHLWRDQRSWCTCFLLLPESCQPLHRSLPKDPKLRILPVCPTAGHRTAGMEVCPLQLPQRLLLLGAAALTASSLHTGESEGAWLGRQETQAHHP